MASKFKVKVSKEHVGRGQRNSISQNPIVLAVQEQVGGRAHLGKTKIFWQGPVLRIRKTPQGTKAVKRNEQHEFPLSRKTLKFIADFDRDPKFKGTTKLALQL